MSGSSNTGIVTSESGGKWYVNPIRTVLELGPGLVPLFGAAMHAGAGIAVGSGHGGGWPGVIPSPGSSPTR